MPKVKGKEYPYTKEGIKMAMKAANSKKSGSARKSKTSKKKRKRS